MRTFETSRTQRMVIEPLSRAITFPLRFAVSTIDHHSVHYMFLAWQLWVPFLIYIAAGGVVDTVLTTQIPSVRAAPGWQVFLAFYALAVLVGLLFEFRHREYNGLLPSKSAEEMEHSDQLGDRKIEEERPFLDP